MSELYVNVGSEKCCLFVKMSVCLLKALERNPLLYYAVEESLECAKIGYYGIGILAFAQILNVLNRKTPPSRNSVAHEILRQRPTKGAFEQSVEAFKYAAAQQSERERRKHFDVSAYQREVVNHWESFIRDLHEAQ